MIKFNLPKHKKNTSTLLTKHSSAAAVLIMECTGVWFKHYFVWLYFEWMDYIKTLVCVRLESILWSLDDSSLWCSFVLHVVVWDSSESQATEWESWSCDSNHWKLDQMTMVIRQEQQPNCFVVYVTWHMAFIFKTFSNLLY